MSIRLMTDSCCDLPRSIIEQYGITVLPLTYSIEGEDFPDDLWQSQPPKAFFDRMRNGATPKTSQVNVDRFITTFRELTAGGDDVLYLAFSSALSGTANAAVLARKNVMQADNGANVTVIDTKSASLGQGLLVYETARKLAETSSLSELVAWVEERILHINHWFTVGNLEYLRRGGRISSLASTMGTLLSIKPVLRINNEGHLIPWAKARGRKRSVEMLRDLLVENIEQAENQTIAISHGDCLEEANYLAEQIQSLVPVQEVIVNPIGPVIGSHAGPETLAIFFFGKERS